MRFKPFQRFLIYQEINIIFRKRITSILEIINRFDQTDLVLQNEKIIRDAFYIDLLRSSYYQVFIHLYDKYLTPDGVNQQLNTCPPLAEFIS